MKHAVKFAIPSRDLGRADVIFSVKRGGRKLGELHVSKGALVWFPRDASKGHRFSWVRFDQWAKTKQTREKR